MKMLRMEECTPAVVVLISNVVLLSVAIAYAYTLKSSKTNAIYVIMELTMMTFNLEPTPNRSSERVEALQAAFRTCRFRSERYIETWSPSREGF